MRRNWTFVCATALGKQLVVFYVVFGIAVPFSRFGHYPVKFARQHYHATVDSAVLTALDSTPRTPPNSTAGSLRYDLSVNLSFRNRDIISVWYSEISAAAFYNGSMLGLPEKWIHSSPSGEGRPKNRAVWQTAFRGTVAVSSGVAAELDKERKEGTVHVQLRVSVRLARKLWPNPLVVYGAYNCWLWFPTPRAGAPAIFDAGTRCWPLH